jgi:hypothetical protein
MGGDGATPEAHYDGEWGVWDFPECPFIFPRKENHIECLPLEDVGKGQYSEGHFANMTSAASDSDTVSSSSIPY